MISAIVPTFERAELLPRALESIERQTLPSDEVIVVDDGSTDGTGELVRSRFPGVRYLRHEENRGVSAARNLGIREARGEWLALLDSDDEWLPRKLELQMAAVRSGGELACHTDEIWMRNGRRVNPRRRHAKAGGWIFAECLPLCALSPSSILVHRSVLDEIGVFDETLPACEDYDLWLRLAARYPVRLVDEALVVKHGGHSDQLSRRVPALDRYRIRALEKILDSGSLEVEQQQAAAATLLEKARIYAAGAAKRGRDEEVARCRELIAAWSSLVDETSAAKARSQP